MKHLHSRFKNPADLLLSVLLYSISFDQVLDYSNQL